MSCYEKGLAIVKIPTSEWKSFKSSIENHYSSTLEYFFNIASSLYNQYNIDKKMKKVKGDNIDYMLDLIEKDSRLKSEEHYYFQDKIKMSLIKNQKISKPNKKDFSYKQNVKIDKIKKTSVIEDSSCVVVLDSKKKTVVFETEDNNHAYDIAIKSNIGKKLFRMLDNVKHTSHTGGYIKYHSEYDEDSSGMRTGYRIIKRYGKYSSGKYLKLDKFMDLE